MSTPTNADNIGGQNGWHTPTGAYGIEAVDPSTPGAIHCGHCGRAWVGDFTPAGRCPWEYLHDDEHPDDGTDASALERWAREVADSLATDKSNDWSEELEALRVILGEPEGWMQA